MGSNASSMTKQRTSTSSTKTAPNSAPAAVPLAKSPRKNNINIDTSSAGTTNAPILGQLPSTATPSAPPLSSTTAAAAVLSPPRTSLKRGASSNPSHTPYSSPAKRQATPPTKSPLLSQATLSTTSPLPSASELQRPASIPPLEETSPCLSSPEPRTSKSKLDATPTPAAAADATAVTTTLAKQLKINTDKVATQDRARIVATTLAAAHSSMVDLTNSDEEPGDFSMLDLTQSDDEPGLAPALAIAPTPHIAVTLPSTPIRKSSAPPSSAALHYEDGIAVAYIRSPSGSPLSPLPPTPRTPGSPLSRPRKTPAQSAPPPPSFRSFKPTFQCVEIVMKPNMRLPKALGGAGGARNAVIKRAGPMATPSMHDSGAVLDGATDDSELSSVPDSEVDDSSSDSDDDEAEMEAMLARARARRADGTALLKATPTETIMDGARCGQKASPSTHELGSLSPEIRRSSRIPVVSEKLREKVVPLAEDSLLDGLTHGRGKFSFNALVKDTQSRQARNELWEKQKLLLLEEPDFSDSDESDSERTAKAKASLGNLTGDHIDDLVSIAHRAAAANDDLTRSPERRRNQEKAAEIADLLKHETGRNHGASAAQAEACMHRSIWTQARTPPLPSWPESDGWLGSIAKALNAAALGTPFPPPSKLFSRSRGMGSTGEQRAASDWLLQFLCHPHTLSRSVTISLDNALQLLSSLLNHGARSAIIFVAADKVAELVLALGATGLRGFRKSASVGVEVGEPATAADQVEELGSAETTIADRDRYAALRRILLVLQSAAALPIACLPMSDMQGLVIMCVQLGLDPNASQLRGSIERTLQSLLERVDAGDGATRFELHKELLKIYSDVPVKTQLEVLRILPHRTKSCALLRKWVAWAFIVGQTDHLVPANFASGLPIERLTERVNLSTDGPFRISREMDDLELHHHAMILSLALTDLGLQKMPASAVKLTRPIDDVDKLQKSLSQVDKAIRTNVKTGNPARNRAQNAFTRLAHSLTYQSRWARNFVSESIIDEVDEDDEPAGRNSQRRIAVHVESGQTRLSFGPRPQLS